MLELAATFAEIVSLLADFKQERGAHTQDGHQKFLEWLQYHRHDDLKNFIANTAAVRAEVDAILRADHAAILQKLNAVSDMLVKLTGAQAEFKGLALAVAPASQLSEQAIFILRQCVESGASEFHYFNYNSQQWGIQAREGENSFDIYEYRFLDDDIGQLVALGLLTGMRTGSDTYTLTITRAAVRFIESLPKPETNL